MPNAKSFDSKAYIKYSCVPHSSVNSYVTIAMRSLHASYPFELFKSSVDTSIGNTSCCTPSDPMQIPSAFYGDSSYANRYRVSVRLLGQGGHTLDGVRMPLSTTFSSVWRPVDSLNTETLYPALNRSHTCSWEENVLVFPVKWKDLPRNAIFFLEVFAAGLSSQTEKAVAVGTYSMWDNDRGTLKMGLQKIRLSPSNRVNPDSQEVLSENDDSSWNAYLDLEKLTEMARVADLQKISAVTNEKGSLSSNRGSVTKSSSLSQRQIIDNIASSVVASNQEDGLHENESTRIKPVPWLDEITMHRCEQILKEDRAAVDGKSPDVYRDDMSDLKRGYCSHLFIPTTALGEDKQEAVLIVEFPHCQIPVVYEEMFYNCTIQGASGSVSAFDLSLYHKHQSVQCKKLSQKSYAERLLNIDNFSIPMPNPMLYKECTSDKLGLNLVQLLDFECEEDNPVEEKYRTLQHELIRGLVDPALKPDKEQRARINAIIGSTSQHLTREEKDLLWRFRFSLVDNRKALTKFLLAVEWAVESEVVQAAELLSQWRMRSPIEITDALRLLGKNVAFRTSLVRTYAIETLAASPDDELVLYLLQLVQALKYEHVDVSSSTQVSAETNSPKSSLDSFLIERATRNIQLANFLYWYLRVEMEDSLYNARYRSVFNSFREKLSCIPFNSGKERKKIVVDSKNPFLSLWGHDKSDITVVECSRSMWDVLTSQDHFITWIMNCQKISREAKGKKDNKEQHLRELLKSENFDSIDGGGPVPLPSAPNVMVRGVKSESVRMFKSALYPALIEFITDYTDMDKESDEKATQDTQNQVMGTYKVIVKTGDDLRQDQLVIMMIFLMDGILKRGTLDLCLKPYSIIATSTTSGLVEFVDNSFPISQILSTHNNSIMQFFQKVAPLSGAKYGVNPSILERYIRSCAGYCVITYLLGVGDRHLDNIMLQASGHFFHIDFGFIFGRDPKPLPPAFRLTREMVEGMGGFDSLEYRQFCSLACQAFNVLRKSAGLILNLLYLMCDAGIEDLSNNPYSDSEGVIMKVEERFRLELTDEQAETFFLGLINDCLSAFAPRVMDVFHQIAVSRR